MDAFVSRKRRRLLDSEHSATPGPRTPVTDDDDESTDFKIALLASLHPNFDGETLLEALLVSDGSVEKASEALKHNDATVSPRKKVANGNGYQSSLSSFHVRKTTESESSGLIKKPLTKKGRTLHLYSPEDIEAHTPCSIIHNFLPSDEADALLLELLEEAPTFARSTFKLFDRVVSSPHTFAFFVDSYDEADEQKTEYIYDGKKVEVGEIHFKR